MRTVEQELREEYGWHDLEIETMHGRWVCLRMEIDRLCSDMIDALPGARRLDDMTRRYRFVPHRGRGDRC